MICPKHNYVHDKGDFCPNAIKAKKSARKARRAEKLAENADLMAQVSGNGPSCPDPIELVSEPIKPPKRATGILRRFKARPKKRRKIRRGPLKRQIVRLLGLTDAKKNGNDCRLAEECPRFPEVGVHPGDCAYHVWPAGSGDFVRLSPLAVVWACSSANYGEYRHRLKYRDKHERVFGKERMELLRAMSYQIKNYPMSELLAMRENLKAGLGETV